MPYIIKKFISVVKGQPLKIFDNCCHQLKIGLVVGTASPTIIKNVESANANIILVCFNLEKCKLYTVCSA